jgi:hypothetical protein
MPELLVLAAFAYLLLMLQANWERVNQKLSLIWRPDRIVRWFVFWN